MAADDFVEASFERSYFQITFQTNCRSDVIDRTIGLKLIKEPETLLGKGERQGGGA